MSAIGNKRKRNGNAPKFYAVRAGRNPGVYNSWDECFEQVKGAKGAIYKSFGSLDDAKAFMKGTGPVTASGTQKFYAVRRGHTKGIYTDWPTAHQQVTGYHKPEYKGFKTRIEAETFMGQGSSDSNAEPSPKKSKIFDDNVELPPGYGPLPTDAEDGFDHTITLDTATGKVRHKTIQELNSLKAVSRHGPASESEWIKIYTDGACRSNGQRGAIAGVGVWFGPNDERNVSERLLGDRQTNQRAELTALKRALDMCPMNRNTQIFSDSKYAINCVTKWFQAWEAKGWKTSTGKVVENRDLVETIVQRIRERDACKGKTKFEWVKGHSSDRGNAAADTLAVGGTLKVLDSMEVPTALDIPAEDLDDEDEPF